MKSLSLNKKQSDNLQAMTSNNELIIKIKTNISRHNGHSV